jgi:hypothetical protein
MAGANCIRSEGMDVIDGVARSVRAASKVAGRRCRRARAAWRFVGLALGLSATGAGATADGPDFYEVRGVAKGDMLNIRAEPSAKATKVGEVPRDGTCLRSLGCQGGLSYQEFSELSASQQRRRLRDNPRWCQIEHRGVRGWVSGRYLGEAECPQGGQ